MRAAVPIRPAFKAFWRRDASTHVVCIVAVGAMFAVAVYAGAHSSRYWEGLFRLVMLRAEGGASPHAGRSPRQGESDGLRLLDQQDSFGQARVGLLKFAAHGSDLCRQLTFDNRTGLLTDAGLTLCGGVAEVAENFISESRVLAMQRAFRR